MNEMKLNYKFDKYRVNNIIVIGGTIGAGKSTLTEALAKKMNIPFVSEDVDKDELKKMFIEKQYSGNTNINSSLQTYFLLKRLETYKKSAISGDNSIFDRSIYEDRIFTQKLMTKDVIEFSYYDKMWRKTIQEVNKMYGVPKLYVILDLKWEDFRDRIFKRGRESEIENFDENIEYFKDVHATYISYLETICKCYGIEYIKIDASISTKKQVEIIVEKLKEKK